MIPKSLSVSVPMEIQCACKWAQRSAFLPVMMIWVLSTGTLLAGNHEGSASADTIHHTDLELPLRGIFYYAWYPNNWAPNGYHVTYHPTYGYYDNNDRELINHHIDELEYANVDVVIASWWGLDNDNRRPRDWAIKKCMEETDRRASSGEIDLKWAIYYELEASYNEPMDTIRADLDYLMDRYVNAHECYAHIDGKPVIFVYTKGSEDNTEAFMKKWADAVDGNWYYVLKVFGGYKDMPYQPSSWHQYGPSTRMHKHEDSSRRLVCINISPGFKHADPNKTTFLERASEALWTDLVKEMVGSKVDWQLITSYNEWGEGTSVESALEWQTESGYGMYLDVLHDYATPEDLATSVREGSHPSGPGVNPPYSVVNGVLRIQGKADRVLVCSVSGRVIRQVTDVSELVLEGNEPIVFIAIQMADRTYHCKVAKIR
jgi:hypothetical protein